MNHAAKLSLYEKVIATQSWVECKGATMRYTSMNGHMFSFLSKTGEVAIRLPDKEREAFLGKYSAKLTVQHGVVMKALSSARLR